MKYYFDGDDFCVESNTPLIDCFFTMQDTGETKTYRCFWMFAKDFFNRYHIPMPGHVLSELRERIGRVIDQRKDLDGSGDESEAIMRYSAYLNDGLKPYSYQAKAVRYITDNKRVLLADDVGLGKSLCSLLVILDLIEKGEVKNAHIIVPASLRLQWLSEIRKFMNKDMFPDLSILINNKPEKERAYMYKMLNEEHGQFIMISSYDMVRRDEKKLKNYNFDIVVLDEASYIKNKTSKINKAINRLYGDLKYKLAMTATPIENGLDDLYCIAEFIDGRVLNSKQYFLEQYCIVENKMLYNRGTMIQKIVGYKNLKDARQKLKTLYIRRTVHDIDLELPDVIHLTINLEMTKQQIAMYNEVLGKVQGDMNREDILGQMIYLQEICDNPELIDKQKSKDPKTTEMKRLLKDDLKYQKVIIITRFKRYAEILRRELAEFNPFVISGDVSMEERQGIIKAFENNEDRRLIIGTEAVEYGLNLQVASVLINADLPWNPAKLKQRMGRIYRIGSEHDNIRMINLVMTDTIEERVLEVLYEKGRLFESIFKNDQEVKISNMLGMGKGKLLDILKRRK